MEWNDVLTPRSPRWPQFIDELAKAPICLRTDENARRVLEAMPGVDVEASLQALHRMGARCDCEILFDLAGHGSDTDTYVPARGGDRRA